MNNIYNNNIKLKMKEKKNNLNDDGYSINNNYKNNNENSKEDIIINNINNENFNSFRNLNDLNSNELNNNKELNIVDNIINFNKRQNIQQSKEKNNLKMEYIIESNKFDESNNQINNNNNIQIQNNNQNIEHKKNKFERENQNIKILKNLINFGDKKEKKTKKINKKTINNIQINNYNTYRNPIELTLYNDAIKRRKKLENIDNNIQKGIKLNSNKTKITNASYKVAIEHEEKIIEKKINKYSTLNKNNIICINIIGIALSLKDMKIFRELFKEKNYDENRYINNYNITDLKKIISSVDIKESRKIKEINFLIQTWLLLNPEQNEYINKDTLIGLLKIIFSPEGTIKEIESLLKKYLEAALTSGYISKKLLLEDKNNINNNQSKKNILCYPLSNKKINLKDLWPLTKYIKAFFDLKKNLIAYKTTNTLNGDKYSNLNLKHQKIQSNINKTNYTLENENNSEKNKKLFNFDKLYKNFLEKEKNKKNTLEKMRKKKEEDELKELKPKPTISKYIFNKITENELNGNKKEKGDIHDRLYKLDKTIRAKKLELIKEKEKKEKEKIDKEINSDKLSINIRLNQKRMNKSFDHPYKCRGFDQYVERNKKGRLERLRVKYLLEKSPAGEKYEEIRRKNITPPNITDIRNMRKKEYKKAIDYANKNVKNKKDMIKPEEFSDNESDGNTEYFNLQVKLPNGKIQVLKIYENDDANKVVEEFCKIHSVDRNIKNKLVSNIENCQKQFLNKDIKKNDNNKENEEEEEDEEIEEENNILFDENNQQ